MITSVADGVAPENAFALKRGSGWKEPGLKLSSLYIDLIKGLVSFDKLKDKISLQVRASACGVNRGDRGTAIRLLVRE
jgi:hypothetical protein